jgi:hypothetical protein
MLSELQDARNFRRGRGDRITRETPRGEHEGHKGIGERSREDKGKRKNLK